MGEDGEKSGGVRETGGTTPIKGEQEKTEEGRCSIVGVHRRIGSYQV